MGHTQWWYPDTTDNEVNRFLRSVQHLMRTRGSSKGGPQGIFISYRRSDTEFAAKALFDECSEKFGKQCVFKDIDSMGTTVDYRERIKEAIADSKVVLVLIGRHWISASDGNGKRRLENKNDPVRLEIEFAFETGVEIIPILCGDVKMPTADNLPKMISRLVNANAFLMRSDSAFERDLSGIVKAIDNI